MEPDDARFLRVAIDLARHARAGGADPFGAALVRDGVVVHQIAHRCVELSDPTFHAELSVISEYRHAARQFSLAGMTLYSSAKPCPMRAGAIHRARISRVVFSVSQAMLQERAARFREPGA
jgi:tRNA(Arg) A34 adenosine deaminase TadA